VPSSLADAEPVPLSLLSPSVGSLAAPELLSSSDEPVASSVLVPVSVAVPVVPQEPKSSSSSAHGPELQAKAGKLVASTYPIRRLIGDLRSRDGVRRRFERVDARADDRDHSRIARTVTAVGAPERSLRLDERQRHREQDLARPLARPRPI
jgi:hypothetical protein